MMLAEKEHSAPKASVRCVEYEAPKTKINEYHGAVIDPDRKRWPFGRNFSIRDCALKNTDFVEGIVVYGGHESKAMLNHGGPRNKRTQLEQAMNLDVVR
jgi:phospholipid-translocating ATPase